MSQPEMQRTTGQNGQNSPNPSPGADKFFQQYVSFIDGVYGSIIPLAAVAFIASSFVSPQGTIIWGDGFLRIQNGRISLPGTWLETISGLLIFSAALWYILDDWYHSRLQIGDCQEHIIGSGHPLPMFTLDVSIGLLNFLVLGFALSGSRALGLLVALHLFLGGMWAHGMKVALYDKLEDNQRQKFRSTKLTHFSASATILVVYFWRWNFNFGEWIGPETASDLTPGVLFIGIMLAYLAWIRPFFEATRP